MPVYLRRELEKVLTSAARSFPAIVLTGPRRSGKTFLLTKLLPSATYVLAEDPDVVARLRADPQGFLDALKTPAILDEVQNVPELFAYVRARIDAKSRKHGQWILTGSQEAPLMHHVSESMAGRAAVLQLLPLSSEEDVDSSFQRVACSSVDAKVLAITHDRGATLSGRIAACFGR